MTAGGSATSHSPDGHRSSLTEYRYKFSTKPERESVTRSNFANPDDVAIHDGSLAFTLLRLTVAVLNQNRAYENVARHQG